MNVWASSAMDPGILALSPARGTPWSSNVKNGSRMLLITETWSMNGNATSGFSAAPTCGARGTTPGQRWGGGTGITPTYNAFRWGKVNSELAYLRHRKSNGPGRGSQPFGRINIAYADGHVDTRRNDQLADSNGFSTGDTFWAPGF